MGSQSKPACASAGKAHLPLPRRRLSCATPQRLYLAATPQRLYLAAIAQIWRLENVLGQGQLANQQSLHYERLYVPRMAQTTGDVDAHELAVDGQDRLIFVNTKYSCLATLDPVHSSSRCGSRASSRSLRPRTAAI
jgi:uncharacterized protein (TIGR03032 family)